MTNPEELQKATKEELVELYAQTLSQEEEVIAQKDAIKRELMLRMDTDAEVVGEFTLSKAKRVSFKTTLAQAKELGAVKETPDTALLKQLFTKGVPVPGVTVTEYLMIKNVAQKEE